MNLNYLVNMPLGMGSPLARPEKKIPLAIPLIMAGASVASSLWGASKSRKAARESERRQREREAEEAAWFRRNRNESLLDTAIGQNMLRRANDFARENWQKASGAQSVGGGTDAATAMAKEAGNKMMSDTVGNIAAKDVERQQSLENIHQGNRERFAQMDMNRSMVNSQNTAQAASAVSNSLMQGAISTFGGTKLGQKWMSGTGGVGGTDSSTSSAGGNSLFGSNNDWLSKNWKTISEMPANYERARAYVPDSWLG